MKKKLDELLGNAGALTFGAFAFGNLATFLAAWVVGPTWLAFACLFPPCWIFTGPYGIYLILTWIGIA